MSEGEKQVPSKETVLCYFERTGEGAYAATSHFGFDSRSEESKYFVDLYEEYKKTKLTLVDLRTTRRILNQKSEQHQKSGDAGSSAYIDSIIEKIDLLIDRVKS